MVKIRVQFKVEQLSGYGSIYFFYVSANSWELLTEQRVGAFWSRNPT